MKFVRSGFVLGTLALTTMAATSTSVAASDTADIYVVQGLPGVTADISVDGKVVAEDVASAKVVGPFAVAAGTHPVVVSADGKEVATASAEVGVGDSKDLVVHLPTDPKGAPVITSYTNDVSSVPSGKARLTVAHTAAVGPADILVDDKVLFANVANGEELTLVVPADTYSVKIVPTGKTEPVVLGPLDLEVKAGALNRVFAIGDPSTTTMTAVAQLVAVAAAGSDSPTRVDSGTGGTAATSVAPVLQPAGFLGR